MTNEAKHTHPLDALRHHVTGAIERGEAEAITEVTTQQQQHTPGPWTASHLSDSDGPYYYVTSETASTSVAELPPGKRGKANAHRIVACVNALEGKDPEKLGALLTEVLSLVRRIPDDGSIQALASRRVRAALNAFNNPKE